jgi:plasmid stabilization system protein ParE
LIWHVHVHLLAQADIEEACEWYDQQGAGLGAEFLRAVEDALAQLEQHPTRQRVYYRGLRRILTERFPYKLFYLVDDENVHVLRVLHGRREHRRIAY